MASLQTTHISYLSELFCSLFETAECNLLLELDGLANVYECLEYLHETVNLIIL